MRAALSEDDGSRDDEFGGAAFGAEAFSRAGGGFVGAALGGVGGWAGLCGGDCRWVLVVGGRIEEG